MLRAIFISNEEWKRSLPASRVIVNARSAECDALLPAPAKVFIIISIVSLVSSSLPLLEVIV
jgi:hypothetical protein